MPVDENDGGMLEESLGGDIDKQPGSGFMENTLSALLTDEDSCLFSSMECKVLKEYLAGRKYPEIAKLPGKSYKAVDNAMQRIRKKISEYMNN